MESAIKVETERPHVRVAARVVNHSRGITGMLLGLACLAGATVAQAQAGGPLDAAAESVSETPWLPNVLTAIDPYVQDPAFRLTLDHFGGATTLDQQGLFTAQLANGNVVTVGLVPDGAGGGTCSDGTKLCSIGLVRYSQTGQRVPWPNAGAYGRNNNEHLVYPGASSSFRYQFLHDIKVRGQYIDVLVDEPDANHSASTLGHRNVGIVTFRDDGSYVSAFTAFGRGLQSQDNEDFYGAQMVQMINDTIIVVATAFPNPTPYVAVNRLSIQPDGTLSQSLSWGVAYANDPGGFYTRRIARYFPPTSFCNFGNDTTRCAVTASYVANQVGFAEKRDFFVAGSLHYGTGTDYDPIAVKISSIDGSQKGEFNTSGWQSVSFDEPDSSLEDRTAGLYVYQNEVYMAASVSRKCQNGIGLARVDGATGSLINSFGTSGKIVFGGSGGFGGGICPTFGATTSVPAGISATGGRIGIAGFQVQIDLSNNVHYDPILAVVDAVNGSVLSFDHYPVTRADGSRYGDATLSGIYGGNLGTSPFTVSGVGRDASAGNTLSYLTGKLIPVSSDRIFANNFGNGDDH